MVTSPKTGRELDGERLYNGPEWFRRLVHDRLIPWFVTDSDKESEA